MTSLNLTSTSPFNQQWRKDNILETGQAVLDQRNQARAERATQTLLTARQGEVTPDIAVRGQQLATTALSSPGFRLMDQTTIDSLEAKVQEQRERALLLESPKMSAWAADYNNAIVAHDDLENIGWFESLSRAFLKSTDRNFDNVVTGTSYDLNQSTAQKLRDGGMTLDELITDEWSRDDIEEAIRLERSGIAIRDLPRDPSVRIPAMQEAISQEVTDEDVLAWMAAKEEDGGIPWSQDAKALWRWFTAVTPVGEETREALVDIAVEGANDALETRAFEAREREGFWPTPSWRQDIERQFGELDSESWSASLVGMLDIARKNPARSAQYLMEIAAESGMNIGAAMAATYVTRNPSVGAGVMGAASYVVGSETFFDELVQDRGIDIGTVEGRKALLDDPEFALLLRDKSKRYGIVVGLMDAASGGLASKTLVDNPVGNMIIQTIAQGLTGGGGELLGRLAADEAIDWVEVYLEAFAETITTPFDVAAMTVHRIKRDISKVQQAKESQTLFEVLSGRAEESNLKARDRAKFAQAIEAVTENGPIENVYVDPAQMEELFQSGAGGVTLEEFFNNVPDLDIREFRRAVDNGSTYAIPTGTYAAHVAGSDLDVAFREHLKFNPEDMSSAEAKQFAKSITKMKDDLGDLSEEVDTIVGKLDGPLADEMDRLASEIAQATGHTPAASQAQAAVMVNAARVDAQRSGMTTAEYIRRYTLPYVRSDQVEAVENDRKYVTPDAVREAALAGDNASDLAIGTMETIQELERRGIDPTVASNDEIVAAIGDLQGTGVLSSDTVERPVSVDRPDDEEMMQTVSLRNGEETASDWGIDTSVANRVRDIALKLEARQRELYGKTPRDKRDSEVVDKFSDWMADEIEFELQTPGQTAKGWYTDKYDAAIAKLSEVFPELKTGKGNLPGLKRVKTPEDARTIFTAILAITSNGTRVTENFRTAVTVYNTFRTTGRLEIQQGGNTRVAHMRSALARYSQMLNEIGNPTEVKEFLTNSLTASEANKILKENGLPKMSGVPADMIVPMASAVFGPKLGAFFANLSGSSGYLTMDLWWTRTINRYRGDVLPKVSGMNGGVNSKGKPVGLNRFKHLIGKPELTDSQALNFVTEYAQGYADRNYKDGTVAESAANTLYKDAFIKLAEQPQNASDRAFMVDIARSAQAKVADRTGEYYSIADIQALIWFYEKRLYADMGVGAKYTGDISYEEAATQALQSLSLANNIASVDVATYNQGSVVPEQNLIKENTLIGPDDNPVMLYVGTDRSLSDFKGGRIFLTNNRGRANEQALRSGAEGARVVAANATLQNPLEVEIGSGIDPDTYWLNNTISIEEELRQGDHDSVMIWNPEGDLMVVATGNDQITQVTEAEDQTFNRGSATPSDDVLSGLEKASPGRVKGVRELASRYMVDKGLPVRHQSTYAEVDVSRAVLIANEYEAMEHRPNDPTVKAAYDALVKETLEQFEYLNRLGIVFEWITGDDPYSSPADAIRDIQENNHLWVFPTDLGFGSVSTLEAPDDPYPNNPLLKPTGINIDGRDTVVNDIFRIVHDVFGHGSEGASFGPRGEENAWQAHVRMFSPLAARAMTTETRGQNSWVNYGPHGEANRKNPQDTVFADQKTGLLPEWVTTEGIVEDVTNQRLPDDPARTSDFIGSELKLEDFQRPGWVVISASIEGASEADNAQSLSGLRKSLETLDHDFIEMQGVYNGQDDGTSFMVTGIDARTAEMLGRLYKQETILDNRGLVYTDGSGRLDVPFTGLKVGKEAQREDFHSVNTFGTAWSLDLQFATPGDRAYIDANGNGDYYGLKVDGGKVDLVHWATEERSTIDPAEAGTGPLRGDERKQAGPNKAYFGANEGRSPTGYKRENKVLGNFKHTVKIKPTKLYPWFEDPDGIKEGLDRSLTSNQQVGQYETLIKDAGYEGYLIIDSPVGDAVVMFTEQYIDRVDYINEAPSVKTEAFKEWFGDSVVTNPDGSPQMQFHGTVAGVDFNGFRAMSHFGTFKASRDRLNIISDGSSNSKRARTVPVYLNIRNPIRVTEPDYNPWQDTADVLQSVANKLGDTSEGNALQRISDPNRDVNKEYNDWLIDRYGLDQNVDTKFPNVPQGLDHAYTPAALNLGDFERRMVTFGRGMVDVNEFWNDVVVKQIQEVFDKAGYDGVSYVNSIEDAGNVSYIALRPSQAKSAWNRGNWDANNADLLEQQNRGSIILPADGSQATIQTFENADLSTIIHETGHYFLWRMQKQREDGLAHAAAEYDTVREWWVKNADAIAEEAVVDTSQVHEYLELGTTGDGTVDQSIHTALHEQFARGFEAYMMEGKSPSNAMRRIFESFAAWLSAVYTAGISQLNVKLDQNIRSVFDRLVATDVEIKAGFDREGVDDMIAETAKEMGLDEDTYRRLVDLSEQARDEGRQIARSELMKAEKQMQSKEYKTRLAEIEAEEREAVINKPVNRAIQWLGNGRWLGEGTAPTDMPIELRMDTDILVMEHGTEAVKKLPKGRRPLVKKETGLSADEVAGWFGFDSGAEMLAAMADALPINEEIKSRVRRRAQEELGDIVSSPEEIEEAVADAMHGDKRGQVIVAELRALNRLSGGRAKKVTTRALASHIAREMIQRMPVREAMQQHRYLSAERKHAEDASRLLANGNVEGAFEAKRKQLIQHQLYSESRKVTELVGRAERLAGRLKKKTTRESLANDYLGPIDDILETYSFRRISGKAEVKLDRLRTYVQMMVEAGRTNELNIPDHVLQATKAVPYKTLSVQRLQGVYDTLKNVEHTARRKQKLIDNKIEREREEVIDELASTMDANIGEADVNRVATRKDKIMSGAKGYFNLARNADTVLRRFDGWENRGIFYRMFKDTIDVASTNAVDMRKRATEQLDRLFSIYAPHEREQMAVRRLWSGYDQAITKWDIISIALNTGNKDNLERLTSKDSRGSFKQSEVDALLDHLEKHDWDFVQNVWDYLDSEYWPQIRDRETRVTGVAPTKVEPMEVQTKFGVKRGGYYPIVYDRRFSAKVSEDRNKDLMENMMAGRFAKAQTSNGHTKERAKGGGGRTIELGMHVLFGHINHVIHDLAYSEAVSDVWSLLQDTRVKSLFEGSGRLEDHQALELWAQDVAAGPAAGTHALAGTLRRLKAGFTMSKLAFNMSTVAIQMTGVTQSIAQVGAANMLHGYSQYASSGFTLAREVSERSVFMSERQKTFQRDAFDLLNDTQLDPLRSKLGTVGWYIMQAGFWAMQKVQFYGVDVPTWLAGHKQGLADGMTDEEASIHADRMVARAQASGLYPDRSAIERGTLGRTARQNEFIRLFTALSSYMFAKFNVADEVLGRTVRDIKDEDKSSLFAALKGASDLALLFVVEAILYNLVKGALPGMGGDEDEGWVEFVAKETAFSVFSVFPFVRDMSSAVQGFGGGGAYGSISETSGRALNALGDLLSGEATIADARAANDLVGIMVPGYPSTAVWRLLDGSGATGNEPSAMAAIMGR